MGYHKPFFSVRQFLLRGRIREFFNMWIAAPLWRIYMSIPQLNSPAAELSEIG